LENLTLRLSDGAFIVSPASLDSSTTYIVLEQGRWFEKEWSFVPKLMRDGMTVVDVGANAGVYSLSLAKRVAPTGRVVAFEPSADARARLLAGKELNGSGNLEVVDAALSDFEGTAILAGGEGVDTELGMIKADGAGASVPVTTLDREATSRGLIIDFLKIDAEGAELSVLKGARGVLSDQTPVVMFEVAHGSQHGSPDVYAYLLTLGYRLFRLIGSATMLIPQDPDAPLDRSELNLFAVKPDRAASLEASGLLAQAPLAASHYDSTATTTYGAPFAPAFTWRPDIPELYLQVLTAYEMWQSAQRSANERAGALIFAYDTLRVICAKSPSLANLCTLGRVAVDFGSNDIARLAFADVIARASHGTPVLDEPFWPASHRYDTLSPSPNPVEWFLAAVVEQQQMVRAYSSIFDRSGMTPLADWLSKTRYASDEMLRRIYLMSIRQGDWVPMPHRLTLDAEGYLNADIWRAGKIPQRGLSS
jgi:FkbM family methyltransferase